MIEKFLLFENLLNYFCYMFVNALASGRLTETHVS